MRSIAAVSTVEYICHSWDTTEDIVTDNGLSFMSVEFRLFTSQNGIIHPIYPLPSLNKWVG